MRPLTIPAKRLARCSRPRAPVQLAAFPCTVRAPRRPGVFRWECSPFRHFRFLRPPSVYSVSAVAIGNPPLPVTEKPASPGAGSGDESICQRVPEDLQTSLSTPSVSSGLRRERTRATPSPPPSGVAPAHKARREHYTSYLGRRQQSTLRALGGPPLRPCISPSGGWKPPPWPLAQG